MDTDYFKVMNLPRSASTSEIKARYKTLAKSYHPDRKGSTARMSQINAAYSVLANPKLRYEYLRKLNPVDNFSAPLSPDTASSQNPKTALNKNPKPPAVLFNPFRSVSYGAIILIIVILVGLMGLFRQSKTAISPSASSASLGAAGGSAAASGSTNPAPQTEAGSPVSTNQQTSTNIAAQAVTFGSNIISNAQRAFERGKTTLRTCEVERAQIAQEITNLRAEMQATQNLMSGISWDHESISKSDAEYNQLEQQLLEYRTQLANLQATAVMC
jgi:curved DNA-binding protein CbpA